MADQREQGESRAGAPETGAAEPAERRAHEFPCATCGAKMSWDPEADALACEYCGAKVPVPRLEGQIEERTLEAAADAARGLGLDVRVSRCKNCGARVTYDERSTSRSCVYCGSPNVLAQEANRNALRPESLVPLDIAREAVRQNFLAWRKRLWFRPSALKHVERFQAQGVYVPFWTFDARVHSNWSADAGYYYYVNETVVVMVQGKPQMQTRRVRKIRWVPAWGERDDAYDDVLVLASQGLPASMVDDLGGFDTTKLVPYRPEYLAGWHAEEYEIDLEAGWELGKQRIADSQTARCAGDVPGDTQRNLRVQNVFSDARWKHVLLPIWSLQYPFRGKTYTVLVNGQTGRVVGKAPWSWVKILCTVLGVALAVLTVIAIVSAME